jgi:predicted Fe-Mo cluster-binding NifX family protein
MQPMPSTGLSTGSWIGKGGEGMKIAIAAAGSSLDAIVENRIENVCCFFIFDLRTMEYETVFNREGEQSIVNSIQLAKFLKEIDVSVVLTGYCSIHTIKLLDDANIEVITGVTGSVREVAQHYNLGFFKNFMHLDTDCSCAKLE